MDGGVVNVSGLVDTSLFPIASRALIRAHIEAEKRGLVVVPATYPLLVGVDYGTTTRATLTLHPPQSEGPLVVTEILPPQSNLHARQQMRVRVQSEWMDDGYVDALDAFTLPRLYAGRLMSAPIVVAGTNQLDVLLADENQYAEAEGIQISGVSARLPDGPRRQLITPPAGIAQEWADAVRAGGHYWGLSLIFAGGTADPNPVQTTAADVVVEAVILTYEVPIEGEVAPSDFQVKVGSHYLTPGLAGPLRGVGLEGRIVLLMPGLRTPVPGGTQCVMELRFPAVGTPVRCTTTFIGRRGGVVGGCW